MDARTRQRVKARRQRKANIAAKRRHAAAPARSSRLPSIVAIAASMALTVDEMERLFAPRLTPSPFDGGGR